MGDYPFLWRFVADSRYVSVALPPEMPVLSASIPRLGEGEEDDEKGAAAMPRPGSHKYDAERRRLRKQLEDQGAASDQRAGERANALLQLDEDHRPRRATERGAGPKGERRGSR